MTKQEIAYRLLHLLLPWQLAKNLPAGLNKAMISHPERWLSWLRFIFNPDHPDWATFPKDWREGDPIPDGWTLRTDGPFNIGETGAFAPLYLDPFSPGPVHRHSPSPGSVSVTKTFTPLSGEDDGHASAAASFNAAAPLIQFGRADPNGGVLRSAFIRFPLVDIPGGAVVEEAHISFIAVNTRIAEVVHTLVYTVAADNPAAPTTRVQFDALALSTELPWDGVEPWTAEETYESLDIKDIMQEVFDLPGWSSGNALIVLILYNAGDESASRDAWSFDGDPAKCPELSITYH